MEYKTIKDSAQYQEYQELYNTFYEMPFRTPYVELRINTLQRLLHEWEVKQKLPIGAHHNKEKKHR